MFECWYKVVFDNAKTGKVDSIKQFKDLLEATRFVEAKYVKNWRIEKWLKQEIARDPDFVGTLGAPS